MSLRNRLSTCCSMVLKALSMRELYRGVSAGRRNGASIYIFLLKRRWSALGDASCCHHLCCILSCLTVWRKQDRAAYFINAGAFIVGNRVLSHWPIIKVARSVWPGPISCRPNGRYCVEKPDGTVTAGKPSKVAGAQNDASPVFCKPCKAVVGEVMVTIASSPAKTLSRLARKLASWVSRRAYSLVLMAAPRIINSRV